MSAKEKRRLFGALALSFALTATALPVSAAVAQAENSGDTAVNADADSGTGADTGAAGGAGADAGSGPASEAPAPEGEGEAGDKAQSNTENAEQDAVAPAPVSKSGFESNGCPLDNPLAGPENTCGDAANGGDWRRVPSTSSDYSCDLKTFVQPAKNKYRKFEKLDPIVVELGYRQTYSFDGTVHKLERALNPGFVGHPDYWVGTQEFKQSDLDAKCAEVPEPKDTPFEFFMNKGEGNSTALGHIFPDEKGEYVDVRITDLDFFKNHIGAGNNSYYHA